MTPKLLTDLPDARVFHCGWQDLVAQVERVDCLIVDAPYSERTHSAHDAGAQTATKASAWAARAATSDVVRPNQVRERRYSAKGRADRAALAYAFWTEDDVNAFVDTWSPKVTGWFVTLTDHVLAPAWEAALREDKRMTFSPIACVEPGSRVRMVGDGPAQWSCFAIVARPRHEPYSKWGALPGAYVVPPGHNPRPMNGGKAVVGGKPIWLLDALVSDYSRPGDLVCDPCSGGGTTLAAALRTGRRAIGCDIDPKHAAMSAEACRTATRPLIAPQSSGHYAATSFEWAAETGT